MQGVEVSCLQESDAREREAPPWRRTAPSESECACAGIRLDVLAYSTVERDVVPEERGCGEGVSEGSMRWKVR